jgi:hypothetical protein
VIQVTTTTNYQSEGLKDLETSAAARITFVGTEGISSPLPLNYNAANCATTSFIGSGLSTYQLSGLGQVGALQSVVLSLEHNDTCLLGPAWVFDEWQVTSIQVADNPTGATYTCPAHGAWVEGSNRFELRVGCQPTFGSGEGLQYIHKSICAFL